jgi:hypothetical protein
MGGQIPGLFAIVDSLVYPRYKRHNSRGGAPAATIINSLLASKLISVPI